MNQHARTSPPTSRRRRTRPLAAVAVAALTIGLAACGASSEEVSPVAAQDALSVTDPWVKAAPSGMTAAFGTVVNDGDEDLVVTGVRTDVTPTMELHETVSDGGAMQMQEKDGGFTIPAGGELELSPGGDHLMLMDLRQPLRPGEEVTFTLELGGGGTADFDAVVKDFSGADEEYVAGHGS